LSKRRDALRRGVRALIFNTSRELAVLEGRPLSAEPGGSDSPAKSPPPQPAAPLGVESKTAEKPRIQSTPVRSPDVRTTEPPARPAPGMPSADPAPRPPSAAPPTPAPSVAPGSVSGTPTDVQYKQAHVVRDSPPPPQSVRPVLPFEFGPPKGEDEGATDGWPAKAPPPPKITYPLTAPPTEKSPHPPKVARPPKTARPAKATRASRTARTAKALRAAASARPRKTSASLKVLRRARSRHRLLPDIPVDGADPQQAFSRTGVCFAYFINNACWRVRDAYCNAALHMCIIRNCPVYHLHKETLERRFARKFEHLW
jgi:hypothetical protein